MSAVKPALTNRPVFLAPDYKDGKGQLESYVNRELAPVVRATRDLVNSTIGYAPIEITGSKGGNAALASLIAALVKMGLVKDSTT